MPVRRFDPPPGTHETNLQFIAVSRISPCREPWHVRRTYQPAELAELRRAIRSSGIIQPLEVLPLRGGLYPLVDGWLRLLSVRQGTPEDEETLVPVRILDLTDPVILLERLFLSNHPRAPLKTLEIGWAMHSLHGFLRNQGLPSERADTCSRLGLSGRRSLASEAWAAAEAVPIQMALDAEAQGRVAVQAIGRVPRAALREFRGASPEALPLLREVLFETLAMGRPPAKPVKVAREQLAVPEALRAAQDAFAAGRPLLGIVGGSAHNTQAADGKNRRGAATKVRRFVARILRRVSAAMAVALSQITSLFTRLAQQ